MKKAFKVAVAVLALFSVFGLTIPAGTAYAAPTHKAAHATAHKKAVHKKARKHRKHHKHHVRHHAKRTARVAHHA